MRVIALGLVDWLVLLPHSGRAEFFCSHLVNTKKWWCHSTLRGRPPSTLGGPARHIFAILLDFSFGWTATPLGLAYGTGRDGYCRVRAAAFVRARFVVVSASFSGDAYLPPFEPRRTSTALSVRPSLYGWASAPLLLASRAGRLMPFDALCVRHARVSARPGLMAGRPAGELC